MTAGPVRDLRGEYGRALALLVLAALMFAAPRGLQLGLSFMFSIGFPVLLVITALVLYLRSPAGEGSTTGCRAGAALFLLAFATTTGFWVVSLAAIEYHTPIGDTGGMLFMLVFMPAAFVYWWPGLAVAVGRMPLTGSQRRPMRAACLRRTVVGAAGGLAAGAPLYIIILNQGWDNTVLMPF